MKPFVPAAGPLHHALPRRYKLGGFTGKRSEQISALMAKQNDCSLVIEEQQRVQWELEQKAGAPIRLQRPGSGAQTHLNDSLVLQLFGQLVSLLKNTKNLKLVSLTKKCQKQIKLLGRCGLIPHSSF